MMRKGQYRIVSEIMLFGIGVAIVSFIIVNFNSAEDVISRTAVKSQLKSTSDLVMLGTAKASLNPNSIVKVTIPSKLSDSTYLIKFEGACTKGSSCILALSSYIGDASVSQEIFNIEQSYNIKGWTSSSANYIDITFINGDIKLERSRLQ